MTIQFVVVISFPMAVGIIVTAPVFTRVILGGDWLPMVTAMQLLAVFGGLRAIGSTISPIFDAIGRPDYNTKLNVLRLGIIATVIYPATAMWGIAGTGVSIIAAGAVSIPFLFLLAIRQIDASIKELLRILFYPVFASVVMGAGVYYLRETLQVAAVGKLPILIIFGISIYTVTMLGIERKFDYGIKPLLRRIMSTL